MDPGAGPASPPWGAAFERSLAQGEELLEPVDTLAYIRDAQRSHGGQPSLSGASEGASTGAVVEAAWAYGHFEEHVRLGLLVSVSRWRWRWRAGSACVKVPCVMDAQRLGPAIGCRFGPSMSPQPRLPVISPASVPLPGRYCPLRPSATTSRPSVLPHQHREQQLAEEEMVRGARRFAVSTFTGAGHRRSRGAPAPCSGREENLLPPLTVW